MNDTSLTQSLQALLIAFVCQGIVLGFAYFAASTQADGSNVAPSQLFTPTPTDTPTPTFTPTLTPTPAATAAPEATNTPSPTATPASSFTPTEQPTDTPLPTVTASPAATFTRTPLPPTATNTPFQEPSVTPTIAPTTTPAMPPQIEPTTTPSETPEPEATATRTPEPVVTQTPTQEASATPLMAATPIPIQTPTPSFTPSPTETPAPTSTPRPTMTPSPVPTAVPTHVLTQFPPVLIPAEHPLYEFRRNEEAPMQVNAYDPNRDPLTIRFAPEGSVLDLVIESSSFGKTISFRLNTDLEPGDYQVQLSVSDGVFITSQTIRYRIAPEATITPSPMPSPMPSVAPSRTPQPTLAPTRTSIPTRTVTPRSTPTLIPTAFPTYTPAPSITPTLSPSQTPTCEPSATPLALKSRLITRLPDLRLLPSELGEPLIDLDDYAASAIENVRWSARPLSLGLRLSVDVENRLYVESAAGPGVHYAKIEADDGEIRESGRIAIKLASIRLGEFVHAPAIVDSSVEHQGAESLVDDLEPDTLQPHQLALQVAAPLPEGVDNADVDEEQRLTVQISDNGLTMPRLLAVAAQLKPTPLHPPTPSPQATATHTPTPVVNQETTRTPTPLFRIASCGDEIAFIQRDEYVTGMDPYQMDAADVNRDGRLDFLIANYGESSATLLTSDDDGAYQTTTLESGEWCMNALFDDFNRDGWPDAVLLGGIDSIVTYYESDSGVLRVTDEWSLPGLISLPEERLEFARIQALTSGVFEPDGAPCMVAALDNRLIVYAYDGGGFVERERYAVPFTPTRLDIIDLEQDGVDELVAVYPEPEGMTIYSIAGGRLNARVERSLNIGFQGNDPMDVIVRDFNRDGSDDIAALTFSRDIQFYFAPEFEASLFSDAPALVVNDMEADDFDGDGEDEILIAGYDTAMRQAVLTLVCGDGAGVYERAVSVPIPQAFPLGQSYAIWSTDFNQDGLPDIALVNRKSGGVVFFENASGG